MTKLIALLAACAAMLLLVVYAAVPVIVPSWLFWLAVAFWAVIVGAWAWQTRFGTRRPLPGEIEPPTRVRWR